MRPVGDGAPGCSCGDFVAGAERESIFGAVRFPSSFDDVDIFASCTSASAMNAVSVARAGSIVATAKGRLLHILDQGRVGAACTHSVRPRLGPRVNADIGPIAPGLID